MNILIVLRFLVYNLRAELVNGRKYYKKDDSAISWDGEKSWFISTDKNKGKGIGYASLDKDAQNLHNTTDWELFHSKDKGGWKDAGEMLRVRGR